MGLFSTPQAFQFVTDNPNGTKAQDVSISNGKVVDSSLANKNGQRSGLNVNSPMNTGVVPSYAQNQSTPQQQNPWSQMLTQITPGSTLDSSGYHPAGSSAQSNLQGVTQQVNPMDQSQIQMNSPDLGYSMPASTSPWMNMLQGGDNQQPGMQPSYAYQGGFGNLFGQQPQSNSGKQLV